MKALILHSRRTGLGIIRSLGIAGFEVYSADVFKAPGFFSRYTKKNFVIPSMIKEGERVFIDFLISIGKQLNQGEKTALFTGTDDYLITLNKYWPDLSPYFIPTFETDVDTLANSLEKGKMYKLAERANVPYPKTFYVHDDINSIDCYPVIIKPTIKKSEKVDVVTEAFRIRKCENVLELKEAIELLKKINIDYVIQQYIPGGDDSLYTAGIFSLKGKLKAAASGRKLRQFPPQLGECSYGELLDDAKIVKYAESFCACSGITGICQVEFKKFNDEYYLMEINPRPWSWISLMTYAGVNLPLIDK